MPEVFVVDSNEGRLLNLTKQRRYGIAEDAGARAKLLKLYNVPLVPTGDLLRDTQVAQLLIEDDYT